LEFKLDEDSGLGVLKVATRRASFEARSTNVTISDGSKSDHYRCPLCSLIFEKLETWVISSWGLWWKEGSRNWCKAWSWLRWICYRFILVLLCGSTDW